MPPGVVNLIAGAGDVGARIVADERVDGVAFTGSVETGKRIAAACAERVARINLEMGGKDPFIVCSDIGADVGVAAKGGAWAAFLNAGQVCTSAERFYVMDDVYDDFLQAFVDYTGGLVIGDPLDSATDNDAGPFGGFKQSGLGRELGREGLGAFQETKHVHIETEIAPKEWWYPYGDGTGEAPPHGA